MATLVSLSISVYRIDKAKVSAADQNCSYTWKSNTLPAPDDPTAVLQLVKPSATSMIARATSFTQSPASLLGLGSG